jgi:hypothetical protein
MLLAQRFAGSTFLESNLSALDNSQNVTAFAASSGSSGMKLALFNKAPAPVKVNLTGLAANGRARALWLKAPAIDSFDHVTFGGSQIDTNGAFHPAAESEFHVKHGHGTIELPSYSAAYIEI